MAKMSCTKMYEDLKVASNANGSSSNTSINTLNNYFLPSPNIEVDKRKNIDLTQRIHNMFDNVFKWHWVLPKVHFLCSSSLYSKPYQVPPRCVAYALHKPFKNVLDWLQKLDTTTPLWVDKTVEWCNSFVLVPKANVKVRLCLEPVQLNQALIRPIHRGPTLNSILPKLNNVQYMSIIDVSLGYHNVKLDEKSSYLTTFACLFHQYQCKQLLFRAAPAGDMFQ